MFQEWAELFLVAASGSHSAAGGGLGVGAALVPGCQPALLRSGLHRAPAPRGANGTKGQQAFLQLGRATLAREDMRATAKAGREVAPVLGKFGATVA